MIEEKKLNLSLKTSNVFLTNDNFNNQTKINNVSINKLKQKKKIRKTRPNKLDYTFTNTFCFKNTFLNLNFNNINYQLLNITGNNSKENNKNIKTIENHNSKMNIINNKRMNTLNNENNTKIYNRLLNNRNNLSSLNREYFLNSKKDRKTYNSLNKNKQNININNNIIININNSNNNRYENNTILNGSLIRNRYKIKGKTKNNSQSKNTSLKPIVLKIKNKNTSEKINYNNNKNKLSNLDSPKKYVKLDKINNPQIPKDYLNIIYYNLLREEQKGINPMVVYNYMVDQNEINEQMRGVLIDWLIDVHHKFKFRDETLFMTILIIDRYCTIRQISRDKLQLLGVTSIMIACKHEEIDLPKIDDFIYITDNAYTKQELIKLENDILIALNFELLYPSPIKFFEYLSLNFNFDKKAHFMGKYLMESFLLDIKYVKYKASVISCACTYIAMKFFKMEAYQESYSKKYFLLNEKEDLPLGHGVKDCAQDICIFVDNIKNSKYLSCFKKYSKDEFENVALLIENKK